MSGMDYLRLYIEHFLMIQEIKKLTVNMHFQITTLYTDLTIGVLDIRMSTT